MNLNMVHRSGVNFSNKFRISLQGRFHKMLSKDFNPGLNKYVYTNKDLNKKFMANYEKITNLIYQNLAWGPIYKFKDGDYLKDADNKSDLYIKESLKIMKIKLKDLQNKKVFNIGTGRESRFFAKYGAEVTHLDLGKDTVKQLKK